MKSNDEKVFLVFNTACFGDVLLCNTLCQNIKKIFPDSKVVFIVDKPFYDVARYQKDVDDVIVFDKRGEHRSIGGFIRFIKEFPYKNIQASFVTYKNFRNTILSLLLGAKKIVRQFGKNRKISVQLRSANLLKKITNEPIVNYPIRYNLDETIDKIYVEGDYITICPLSKRKEKDLPVDVTIDLIKKSDKKCVILGKGDNYLEYVKLLKNAGCEFVNLVNKTTIPQMAHVLKNSKALISVDTGTLHLASALEVPTVAVFYEEDMIDLWAPDEKIYRVEVVRENQSVENILDKIEILLENTKLKNNKN